MQKNDFCTKNSRRGARLLHPTASHTRTPPPMLPTPQTSPPRWSIFCQTLLGKRISELGCRLAALPITFYAIDKPFWHYLQSCRTASTAGLGQKCTKIARFYQFGHKNHHKSNEIATFAMIFFLKYSPRVALHFWSLGNF